MSRVALHHARWLNRAVVLLLLLTLLVPLIPSPRPSWAAGEPRLELSPQSGAAGAVIKVEGRNFPKKMDGELVWDADGAVLATYKTGPEGGIHSEFTVPNVAPGEYSITAIVQAGRDGEEPVRLTSPFTVTPAEQPTEAPPSEGVETPVPTEGGEGAPTEESTATEESGQDGAAAESNVAVAQIAGDSLTLPIRAIFYYPWFPNAWDQGTYPFTNYTPSAGFYDGGDPAVISQQIAAMQYGGMQAGIASWWGQGHHTDVRIPALLKGASGTGFKWTLYHEQESLGDPSVSTIRNDLTYIRDKYASDPSYLRIDGKFVVFVYADPGDACGMVDRWEEANTVGAYLVLKVFAGYKNCGKQPESWHQYSPAVAADYQAGYSYSISPGFWLKGQSVRLARDLTRWQQNVRDMVASGAPWQLVVSFNEWGEGTSVESAKEWESSSGYGQYLDVLANNGGGTVPKTPTPGPTQTPVATKTPAPTTPTATAPPNGNYAIFGSSRSSNSTSPRAIYDGDVKTTWQTIDSGTPPNFGLVYVSLGAVKPIGAIRWVFGTADIADSFVVQVSNDKTVWTDIHIDSNAPVGEWQAIKVNLNARYVRWYFTNPNRDKVIGGLGEVEIYAPGVFSGGDTPTLPGQPSPTATATATGAPATATATTAPGGATLLQLVGSSASANSSSSVRVRDGDPNSYWQTGGTPSSAWVTVDLGSQKTFGAVRWVFGRAGIAPYFYIEGSNDGSTWTVFAKRNGHPVGDWEEKIITLSYRYIRFRFENSLGTYYLGGLGEVQVWTGGALPPFDQAEPQPTSAPSQTATPSTTKTATPAPTKTATPAPGGEAVLLAAGDIADCEPGADVTAKLLDQQSGTIATLGDNAYESGTLTEFKNCYDPHWGRHKDRTRPAPGNHEYLTSGASGYFDYFGTAAGPRGKGWYSYNLGSWHIIALNSNCGHVGGCGPTSEQGKWLAADLAANTNSCTLAYMHHPLFSSGSKSGATPEVKVLWDALYKAGAELILAGHAHSYERFAPQTPDGKLDTNYGLRLIGNGLGGKNLIPHSSPVANSEVRYSGGLGILRLVLKDGSYTWQFISEAGKTFSDSGSGTCHNAPGTASTTDGSMAVKQFNMSATVNQAVLRGDERRRVRGSMARKAAGPAKA